MKLSILVLSTLFSISAVAATEADLDNCTRESNPQLCMSKVLLGEIQRRAGGGGGGGGHSQGVIRFYHDDGRCNSAAIGQVFVTLDASTNRSICDSAVINGEIWGIGIDVGGTQSCFDISDTSSAKTACEQGMRRAGVPY